MSAQQTVEHPVAYAAFSGKKTAVRRDLRDLESSISWTEGGDNALTGTTRASRPWASYGGS